MKVTSFKDVETYLYSSVILPLKRLDVPELDFGSPIQGDNGEEWTIYLEFQEPPRRYRRNYQNTRARNNRDHMIMLYAGALEKEIRYQIGTCVERGHEVYLYEQPFHVLNAMPLFSKLHKMFHTNTPFSKIIVKDSAPVLRPHRPQTEQFVDALEAVDYEGDDDDI